MGLLLVRLRPRNHCRTVLGHDVRSEEELGEDYAGCLQLMEQELVQVAGLSLEEAEKRRGRAEGPKYKWEDQANSNAAGPSKTTSVSRAWRRTASWLADILRTERIEKADSARRKVLHSKHPQPDPGQATPEQLHSMKLFEAWRSTITEKSTFFSGWLTAFVDMATKQADKGEHAARTAATAKFSPHA